MKKNLSFFGVFLILILFASCGGKPQSSTTGWDYNTAENGGYQQAEYVEQITGPGLVLIEGGAFTMGQTEQDVMYDWNNVPRRVTVSSFYMDITEVRNVDYREYLYWVSRVFESFPQVYIDALPDTLVWRRRLAYNEPYVDYYLRHPAYYNYPVVGVNWLQATAYCKWRTDRVNEQLLVDEKILEHTPEQFDEENFNTEAYYAGQYETGVIGGVPNLSPNAGEEERHAVLEDGILLPAYQLPTEAEWEYAALAIVGNSIDELVFSRKLYPWTGHFVRNDSKEYMGQFRANFQRGRGDMMGIAGALNDNASITAPVDAYWPNEYGLYCMAGNVSEWVRDVYRPMNSLDVEGFSPFRGNVFMTKVVDEYGVPVEKDSLGRLHYREVTPQEAMYRYNYQRSDNINYNDGDLRSSLVPDWSYAAQSQEDRGSNRMYSQGTPDDPMKTGITTLINDHVRVYKGGSWRDRVYWLTPGARRFLEETYSRDDIGFRCSMLRVGSPGGL